MTEAIQHISHSTAERPIPWEEWKDIPGVAGYQVSTHGRVMSFKNGRYSETHPAKFGRLLKQTIGTHGYPTVGIWSRNARKTVAVHRLVALAFLGACPDRMEVRHLDGNRENTLVGNLAYGTPEENQTDRLTHGTSNRGSRHGMAKLDEDWVRCIRTLAKYGWSRREIGAIAGIHSATVGQILRRERWGWLK